MLRAIVFDFDGVIANSEPLHYRGYRDVLQSMGVELSEADYFGRYLGYDDQGAFTAIAADRQLVWTDSQIHELVRLKAIRLEELERDGSVLFPGAATAIERAAAACPIAVASGALGAEIRRVLVHAGLERHFATIVAAEDTPLSKPAPDPYLLAVSRLAERHGPLIAADCVAIEDSQWGLQSARAAGLRTVAVAQTYPADTLAGADLVIPTIAEFDVERLRALF